MNPYSRLSTTFLAKHSAAAAHVLEGHIADDVAKLLLTVNPATARNVIAHFTPGFAAACLTTIEPAVAGSLFQQLPMEFQILVLRQIEHDRREPLLNELEANLAASLRRRLPYPDGTAGALMQASLTSIPEQLSVRHAIKRVKRIRSGMKFYIYIVNDNGQLRGVLTLHELVSALSSKTVGQVMHRHVISLSPFQSVQSVIDSPYWQDYYALPVVDEDDLLLGAIRHKSLRRLQEQSVQVDGLSQGMGTVLAVGELFAVAATHLLAALITTGKSLSQRDIRG